MNDIDNAEMDSDLEGNNSQGSKENSKEEEETSDAEDEKQDSPNSNIIHQLLNNPYLGQIVDFITNKSSDVDIKPKGRASTTSDINEENSPAEFSNKFGLQRSPSKSKTKQEIDESNAFAVDTKPKSYSFFNYEQRARFQKDTDEDESSKSSCNDQCQNIKDSTLKDDLLFDIDFETK